MFILSLVSSVKIAMNDLIFGELIRFYNINPNFHISSYFSRLEVFFYSVASDCLYFTYNTLQYLLIIFVQWMHRD